MTTLFAPVFLSDAERGLRDEAREFLARELPAGTYRPGLGLGSSFDADFSAKLGAQGWIGMTLPPQNGGAGRSAVERFVVIEELMAAGAPITAHWAADRQTGPALVHFGTDEQQRRLLPGILAGTTFFALGMSEPEAGSDLASVRTAAHRVEGGWSVTGTKVWTSGAHRSHYLTVLCRTSPSEDRHRGLSQLVVDLSSPGVEVAPIPFLDGSSHFNEVRLTEVFVPDDWVLGQIGDGWLQVTSELVYERSGPDRYMSVAPVLLALIEQLPQVADAATAETLGAITARMWAIRQLSLSVARAIDEGRTPGAEAALVKDVGTSFEQETIEALRVLVQDEVALDSDSMFASLLAQATLTGPSFTLRGGTTEILRTIAAKALTPVGGRSPLGDPLLQETVDRILRRRCTPLQVRTAEQEGWADGLWQDLATAGITGVGVPESANGSGGEDVDALAILRLAGYYAAPVPLAETGFVGGWLLHQGGGVLPGDRPVTVVTGSRDDVVELRAVPGGWRLDAVVHRVPWAHRCAVALLLADGPTGPCVVSVDPGAATSRRRLTMAGEPSDDLRFEDVWLDPGEVLPVPRGTAEKLRRRATLARAALISGACQAAVDLSIEYSRQRIQFGGPIARFQAVAHLLARAAEEAALAAIAVSAAGVAGQTTPAEFEVGAARVVANRAARIVATTTHQVHGAIGMTQEYELQLRTRRLWTWSAQWGSERFWCRHVGELATASGADGFWPLMTRG